jgi:folate-binding protein YgfZ
MPFKVNPPRARLPALSGFGVLAVEGPQSGAFLQAQAMNDVAALAVGEWQWNGWLTAKGRVVALFALLRIADESYRLLLPDHPAAALRESLARFVFRSKLRLEVDDSMACLGEIPAAGPIAGAPRHAVADAGDGLLRLDWGGDDIERGLWLAPSTSTFVAPPDAGVDAAWRDADLRHGLPRLGPAQVEALTPQMLSLERLRAFSLRKGCYPGQEIVARTHYLGQAKRGLVRVCGEALREGEALLDSRGASVGTLVCADAAERSALAVANVESVDAATTVAGQAVERSALAGGLQRPA